MIHKHEKRMQLSLAFAVFSYRTLFFTPGTFSCPVLWYALAITSGTTRSTGPHAAFHMAVRRTLRASIIRPFLHSRRGIARPNEGSRMGSPGGYSGGILLSMDHTRARRWNICTLSWKLTSGSYPDKKGKERLKLFRSCIRVFARVRFPRQSTRSFFKIQGYTAPP